MSQSWLDVRSAGSMVSVLSQEAVHLGFDAVVAADPADLAPLPPTVSRVLMPAGPDLPADTGAADVVIIDPRIHGEPVRPTGDRPGPRFGRYVEVTDADSLGAACASARREAFTVLRFRDPTHIPLEIVLAAAADAPGRVITVARDLDEAAIHRSVLEHGPDGVMFAPGAPGDAGRFRAALDRPSPGLPLTTLMVTGTAAVGVGERACVDTCALLRPDEGILVGSRSKGLLLCVSETHPLPYMPTRPFRVNAGAIMSYTMATPERTSYLSDLRAGDSVLAVDAAGGTRAVTVGRVKIERRPLLAVDAVGPDGQPVNLIIQNDWHVRLLGPGGAVLNSTALRPGDEVLGYLPTRERHVGYPIDELCHEQ